MPIHDEGGGIDYFGDGILSSPQAVRRAAKKAEETRLAKKTPTMINREKIVDLIHAFCEGDVEKQDQLLSEELNFRTSLRQGVDFKENILDESEYFIEATFYDIQKNDLNLTTINTNFCLVTVHFSCRHN